MIGAGLALIVVGILLLFMVPWVGIVTGIVGLVLTALWLTGFGRHAASRELPVDRRG